MITRSYMKVYRTFPEPDYFYIKNEYTSAQNMTLIKSGSPTTGSDLEYRLYEDGEWTPYNFNAINVKAGGKLYFRSTTGFSQNSGAYYRFNQIYQVFSCGGDILTLINYKTLNNGVVPDYSFYKLFENVRSCLIKADLDCSNVASVGNYAFYNCFQGCSILTTTPDFSNVTSVGNYGFQSCFYGCSKLTTAPDFSNLASVNAYGFQNCFYNCSKLTTAPDFSNVTSVGDYGFQSCFSGCSSLTTAPDFSNVTSVGTYGFQYCFNGCSKLTYVYAPSLSSWVFTPFTDWLNNVASYGIVRKKSSLTIPTGTNGVPEGWDVENY